MALKIYRMPDGRTYQFEEGNAPSVAVPVESESKKAEPKAKAVKPKNKAKKGTTK